MKSQASKKTSLARMHRRSFLKSVLAAGTFSVVSPRLMFAQAVPPSEKVNLACIGIGNRGGEIINSLHATGLANIVALCDVDMGAKQTQGILGKFPAAPRFQDFRKMFDKMAREIDAVCIGTPDFSPVRRLARIGNSSTRCRTAKSSLAAGGGGFGFGLPEEGGARLLLACALDSGRAGAEDEPLFRSVQPALDFEIAVPSQARFPGTTRCLETPHFGSTVALDG